MRTAYRSVPCLLIAFLLSAAALIPFLAVLSYEAVYIYRIYPGVSAVGIDLGGLTLAEAQARLEKEFENYAETTVRLRYGDRIWLASGQELGITYDAQLTAAQAYRVGRERAVLESLRSQLYAMLNGYDVPPVRTLDEGSITMYLSKLAKEINRSPRNAQVVIDGFRIVTKAAAEGCELDIPATRAAIVSRLGTPSPEPADVVTRKLQPLAVDVETARLQAERILAEPLVFVFRERNFVGNSLSPQVLEKRWALDRSLLAQMIVTRQVKAADGSVSVTVGLDTRDLFSYFERLAAQINRPARDARLKFDPETGQLSPTVMSQEGYELDVEQAVALANAQAVEPDHELTLPVRVIRPSVAVENIPQMGIKELLAEATTSFKGSSAARVHNIRTAAARFDGVVIAPGEEFSFNHYLGEVSAATGYEESQIIWGDRTAIGIGGGVCQVSTTAFRAAFWAGLPILERYNHGYRVSWYEPPLGMDATVYAPAVDFKFKNDMASYVLIQTETDPQAATVTFRLYGTNQGRTVEMAGPVQSNPVPHGPAVYEDDPALPMGVEKQVEWARDGIDVVVERTVFENGKVIHKDRFFSRYAPWPAVFLRGTRAAA